MTEALSFMNMHSNFPFHPILIYYKRKDSLMQEYFEKNNKKAQMLFVLSLKLNIILHTVQPKINVFLQGRMLPYNFQFSDSSIPYPVEQKIL